MKPNILLPVLRKAVARLSAKLAYSCVLPLAAVLAACNEPSSIGLEVQPPQDKINVLVSDTTTMLAWTQREDSVRSDETTLNLLGSYVDPVFGTATAGFYTQVLLPSDNVSFGSGPVLDSIVLSLAYSGGFYGDTTSPQTVRVFELTEDLHRDSVYYSGRAFQVSAAEIGSASYVPSPGDSVNTLTGTLGPHLRIPLNAAAGQKFLDESVAGGAALANNTTFLAFFRGLYVMADNPGQAAGQGAILYFDLLRSLSKLTIHYRNDDDDSLSFDFIIGSAAARVNRFTHDYIGTVVSDHLAGAAADTALVYVQAGAGLKGRISFPFLANWNNAGNIAINRAEVLLQVEPGSQSVYEAPERLLLVGIDSAGGNAFLDDQLFDPGNTYYGGVLDAGSGVYRFNIARHIQGILNGKKADYGLYILASGSAVSANRVVLGGAASASLPMKLIITYTVF